jgi:4-carboxymuconolactone decarboxylase
VGRLPLGPPDPEDKKVAQVYNSFDREGREPIALYRILSHAPHVLHAFSGIGQGLRYEAVTPRALRELIVLRVAQLTRSDYEWSHHKAMAIAAGVEDRKLRELACWRASDAFDERERAVLRCAEEMHELRLSDEGFSELERHFEPAEIVEIVVMAAHYQAVARVIQALGVHVEPAYQVYLDDEPL